MTCGGRKAAEADYRGSYTHFRVHFGFLLTDFWDNFSIAFLHTLNYNFAYRSQDYSQRIR